MTKNLIIFVILLLAILQATGADICNAVVCCLDTCPSCSTCGVDAATDATCCDTTILASGVDCSSNPAPCAIIVGATATTSTTGSTPSPPPSSATSKTTIQKIRDFLTVQNIIIVSVSLVVGVFIFYSCCIFGKRKPPVPYSDIIWKRDLNKAR